MQLKRGMAPIVATLLLISFAVALGLVIMNFGRAQLDLEAQCPIDIGLEFSKINSIEEICIDTEKNDIYFVIENGINTEVEGVVVNIIGTERAESYNLEDASMFKAGNYMTHIGYNEELSGEIKQLKIIPIIKPFEEKEICTDQALVVEEVREC